MKHENGVFSSHQRKVQIPSASKTSRMERVFCQTFPEVLSLFQIRLQLQLAPKDGIDYIDTNLLFEEHHHPCVCLSMSIKRTFFSRMTSCNQFCLDKKNISCWLELMLT